MSAPLDILYRDERYIAIDKPAGLLVHRSAVDRQQSDYAVQLLCQQIGRPVHPVHRLDRPTSGVLLFALDAEAHRLMSQAFQDRAVEKTYSALVRGHAPLEGAIDRPLRRFLDDDAKRKSDEAQEARTAFENLRRATLPFPTERYSSMRISLLRLRPETGRRHQLRRHLAYLGYPIVGDSRYGDTRFNLAFRQHLGVSGLLLAATELAFSHPFSGEPLRISAPLDNRWQAVQDAMETS